MRCPACRSYIPEGISSETSTETLCPQCGQKVEMTNAAPAAAHDEPAFKPSSTADSNAFAPYFTLRTRLSYAPTAMALPDATAGSISFGPEGLSIVSNDGSQWEKLLYRNVTQPRIDGPFIVLTVADVESRIAFFSAWSSIVPWSKKPSASRARAFKELLESVQKGLDEKQIQNFQDRLR